MTAKAGRFQAAAKDASAGGFSALARLLGGLREGLALPVAVQPLRPGPDSAVAGPLAGRTGLTAKEAEDKEVLRLGVVCGAPLDYRFAAASRASLEAAGADFTPDLAGIADLINTLQDGDRRGRA
ncbi:MAG: CheB methylesterase [Desulfovibrionales bacterium]|nr:CheB methylesterase [Desulfovibrionales bacterium]